MVTFWPWGECVHSATLHGLKSQGSNLAHLEWRSGQDELEVKEMWFKDRKLWPLFTGSPKWSNRSLRISFNPTTVSSGFGMNSILFTLCSNWIFARFVSSQTHWIWIYGWISPWDVALVVLVWGPKMEIHPVLFKAMCLHSNCGMFGPIMWQYWQLRACFRFNNKAVDCQVSQVNIVWLSLQKLLFV